MIRKKIIEKGFVFSSMFFNFFFFGEEGVGRKVIERFMVNVNSISIIVVFNSRIREEGVVLDVIIYRGITGFFRERLLVFNFYVKFI